MSEVVWLVLHNGNIEAAKTQDLHVRVCNLELTPKGRRPNLESAESLSSPRVLVTHLPITFFENQLKKSQVKTLVLMRNIKDTLVSYYHFYRMNKNFGGYTGSFDDFFKLFQDDHLAFGSWFDYTLDWWKMKDRKNFLHAKYEDLKDDLPMEIRRITKFLNKDLDADLIEAITNHTTFDSMKVNPRTNRSGHPSFDQKISPFLRKGVKGDWKHHFSEEQSAYVDKLCDEKLAGTGLDFSYD